MRQCTKPREGTPREALLTIVNRNMKDIGTKYGVGWTKKSSEVLIRLGVELEFLHRPFNWDAKAYAINALASTENVLRLPDRILYLKYFLSGDGGAIVYLAREIIEKGGRIERSAFLNSGGWEHVLERMCQEYLSFPLGTADRQRLKEVRKYAKKGYSPHTREHWFNPRAETLTDLGILEKLGDARIQYIAAKAGQMDLLRRFESLFQSARSVDTILSPQGDFFTKVAKLYQIESPEMTTEHAKAVQRKIVEAYEMCRDESYRFAHLEAIKDITCVSLLASGICLVEWKDVENQINIMRKMNEKHVRFHVDDWGRPNYLVLSPEFVQTSLNQEGKNPAK